ncbi:MAG: zinc ribbon domain-containing protein [Candidatus Omnitrophota bacterium]|nr:zinc ribbon domain-containing protein [Candidatus Omnitrophota bacterium]MBU1928296.1 zinc ribbon domain-containing protein [Candidatus Omnitrophota bacterium]MBU2035548.1 zinc ribbon domain-containing protein [Candidatus Omnitrophota bacterium]MBU2222009.1 zinc ribbon domain-containing protein [Candidatus Omnitrophota bacterium]MBU2257554.1 zinc ribbon domain-containing protein [Candidatus Omnitrophota bacterium]
MPIYEYVCNKCKARFEYFLRSSSEDIACLKCAKKDIRRLISAFAFNSKDSKGNITSSSSGCSGCSSNNCSNCSG